MKRSVCILPLNKAAIAAGVEAYLKWDRYEPARLNKRAQEELSEEALVVSVVRAVLGHQGRLR